MITRPSIQVAATAAAALSLAVVLGCAHPRPTVARSGPYDRESRFPAAAGCALRVSEGDALAAGESGGIPDAGGIVVRVRRFGSPEPVRGLEIVLTPLGVEPRTPLRISSYDDADGVHAVVGLSAGPHAMLLRRIGFLPRADTVAVRAGAVDTVDVAMEEWDDGRGNVHNCRPHGFRRAGEAACVTDAPAAALALDQARSLASPERRRDLALPPGDSSGAEVVRDESLCERAGRAYGGPESPPRRVVVVAVGGLFVVYDPFEPDTEGEWSTWKVFDGRWRFLASMGS